jgi:hypothetical protein
MGAGREVGPAGATRPKRAKRSQFLDSCKTNPISGEAGRWDRPIVRNEPNLPGPIVRNKANSRRCRVRGGLRDGGRRVLYKQSQSAEGAQQWARGGKSALPVPPGPNVRNEANFSIHAKRTQFPARRAAGIGRWCETNPICGPAGRDGARGAWDARQSCETNPICDPPRGTGILPVNVHHGRDAHATVPPVGVATSLPETWGLSCETKPIGRGVSSVKFQV